MRNKRIENLLTNKTTFEIKVFNYEGNENCQLCDRKEPEKRIKLSIKFLGRLLNKYFILCDNCINYYCKFKN